MTEEQTAHIYDFPRYYDLVYGSDWKAEFRFLIACFERFVKGKVKSLFEPACGTGRLMIKFAQADYKVAGNDLNAKAIDFCNDRLEKHGFPRSAFVGDMSDFELKKPVDAAFNMINSFRHLPTEKSAEKHLKCMANALKVGGVYFLGLHLTPTEGERMESESWSARRGNLVVNSSLWTEGIDIRKRMETVGMSFDIYTPTSHQRITDSLGYRTYTAAQMRKLLQKVPEFEIMETYDFHYEIDKPITIEASTEDVVFVLRKRG